MMGVCRKAQTDTKGNKETFDISPISSFKNPVSKSPVEHNDCNNEITGTKTVKTVKSFRKHTTLN